MEDDLATRARARLGQVLREKYRLDRVLGVGGMATVYAATHLRNANRVAVKVLHPELAIDASLRARFLREGYVGNIVEHAGTVRVLDDDKTEDGAVFLVMELLDGETLEALWERNGQRLAAREVAALMRQLLGVLVAAHAKGVVHRDLKPENVFLTREGVLKVLDFGIARLNEGAATRTKSGTVFGTPAFMPPEQALGRTKEVDALSDLWAVGATAFTLLSGRFVHSGETPEELLIRSATQPAPPLTSVAPQVPTPLAAVIDRALAYEKSDRWPSAQAMLQALGGVLKEPNPPYIDDEQTRFAPPPLAEKAPSAPAAPVGSTNDGEPYTEENTRVAAPPEMPAAPRPVGSPTDPETDDKTKVHQQSFEAPARSTVDGTTDLPPLHEAFESDVQAEVQEQPRVAEAPQHRVAPDEAPTAVQLRASTIAGLSSGQRQAEPLRTSTIAGVARTQGKREGPNRLVLVAGASAVLAGGIMGLVFAISGSSRTPTTGSPSTSGEVPSALAPASRAAASASPWVEVVPPTPAVLSSAPLTAHATSSASPPGAAHPSAQVQAPPGTTPAAANPAPVPAAPATKAGCNPPYTVDPHSGKRHFREECL